MEQNIIERLFLESCMLHESTVGQYADMVKPEHFFDVRKGMVYKAMLKLHDSGDAIDVVNLHKILFTKMKVDELAMLTEPVSGVSCSPQRDAQMLVSRYVEREVGKLGASLSESVGNEDVFEMIEIAKSKLEELDSEGLIENDVTFYERAEKVVNSIIERQKSESPTSIMSGKFEKFNRMTGGLVYPTYMSIQGQDKSCKTTFATVLLLDFAQQGVPCVFFNYETSVEQLDWKLLSMATGVDYGKLRNPKGWDEATRLNEYDIALLKSETEKVFKGTNIILKDGVYNERQLGAQIARLSRRGYKYFVVDYMGLIPSTLRDVKREERINEMSRYFRALTKKHNIVLCILSQQNRDGGIAESKALERDPDYSFEIRSPYTENNEENYFHQGLNFTFKEEHYLVKLKRTRHSSKGGRIVLEFNNNDLTEIHL